MRALYVIIPVLGILVIAYRYYSAFIASRLWFFDETRITPAHAKFDWSNYFPTSRWVLFGHHFAAIAGSGPLIGPVLAAQFGWAPGLMWLVGGVCLAGAVQDSFWLWASARRGGRSLADIARTDVSPLAGATAAIAVLIILIIAMAGLGIAVVNALADSAWATFTIFITIPLAVFMGFYMFRWRTGRTQEATIIAVTILFLGVVLGKNVAESSIGHWFVLTHHQVTFAMALYTVAAATLPVWMLLTPRAYLSTFMKIGVIGFLVLGVIVINPPLQAPAFSQFIGGGGPVFPGAMFPFVFITIACGAISGFHALVSTGTTSKMIDRETDIRPIGYGAMLIEGAIGVVALDTSASLFATVVIVLSWAYFIWTGNIATVWPMFGVANQLLGVVAFAVGTTLVINIGRQKYAWITFLPMCFLSVTTLSAGFLNIRDNFCPLAVGPHPALVTQ